MVVLDYFNKETYGVLFNYLDRSKREEIAYRFSLKNGSLFFLVFGILCWCSELVFHRRGCLLAPLVRAGQFKRAYLTIALLYLSGMLVMFTCLHTTVYHHL